MTKSSLSEEDLKKTVRRHLPSVLALKTINYYVRNHKDIADLKEVAEAIGEKPAAVKRIANELVQRSLLKKMGAGLYNYSPEHDVGEKVKEVVHLWSDRTTHRQIMALLPKEEKKKAKISGFMAKIRGLFGK